MPLHQVTARTEMTQKILVVEDEPASLRILQYFLSYEGYDTAGARDGLEAVELLAKCRFDLVLSDITMPRMDGVALARHILSSSPIIPIFLITANVSACFEDILKLGVPYLSKPLLLNQLLVQIHKMLADEGTPNSAVRRVEH
jgi:CheY-like chemotaxis protein